MLSNGEYSDYLLTSKNSDKKEILKEHSGTNIYIPSYKTLLGNKELKQDFSKLIKQGSTVKIQA